MLSKYLGARFGIRSSRYYAQRDLSMHVVHDMYPSADNHQVAITPAHLVYVKGYITRPSNFVIKWSMAAHLCTPHSTAAKVCLN